MPPLTHPSPAAIRQARMIPAFKAFIGSAAIAGMYAMALPTVDTKPMRKAPEPMPLARAAEVQLGMATLHAAALSEARSTRDSSDSPFLIVTTLGSGSSSGSSQQFPSAHQHWAIRFDQVQAAPLLSTIALGASDSVRVLVTLLEGDQPNAAEEDAAGQALAKLRATSRETMKSEVAAALAGLTRGGVHWIGTATLLLTNVDGRTAWRAAECVMTCSVVNSLVQGGGSNLPADATGPLNTVFELTGGKATYHLNLTARRTR
ncbi:MAG: hypothetical protein ACO1Q7_19120 [Gemmatimonas sp.]